MKKSLTRACAAAFAVCILLPVIFSLSVTAESAGPATVSFTSPAIPCDVGDTIALGDYSVQMTKGGSFADDVEWTSSELTIENGSVKADKAGVYALMASSGGKTKTVYLVAKNPEDTEYVLYEADFSDAEKAKSEIKVINQSSGTSWDVTGGKLVLDASSKTSLEIKLAFPDFLGDFGDYNISSDMTITNAANEKRWSSMMFRIQPNNTELYYQMCMRSNATLANGMELAERVSTKWNVTHTAAFKEQLSAAKTYHLEAQVYGEQAGLFVDGECYIYSDAVTSHATGRVGVQVNACRAEYSSFKVTLSDGNINVKRESAYANVQNPESNITLAPSIVTNGDAANIDGAVSSGAASAIFEVKDDSLKLDGGKTVQDVLDAAYGKLIPIFRTESVNAAKALAALLSQKNYPDAFILSSSADVLNAARDAYPLMYGMLDLRASAEKDGAKLSQLANAAQCRVVLLKQKDADRATVSAVQSLLVTVFVECESASTSAHVAAITSGANGIVTNEPASLAECYTKYFRENSVIRTVHVIGHRGVPKLYQENSIAGSLKAYELGATIIENDIRLTKDGVVIAMHDATIDRTTSGTGKVADMTYEQISQYVLDGETGLATQKVPTLEDYFKEFKGKDVKLFIEIKSGEEALITKTAALIEQYGILDQVCFISFNDEQLARVKRYIPGASCGHLNSSTAVLEIDSTYYAGEILELIQRRNATFNPTYKKGIGKNIMAALNHRGASVWPYTINSADIFEQFFMYGTNGITTNYSNWVTGMAKDLTAPESVELNVGESESVTLKLTNYGRETKDTDEVFMVALDEGSPLKYENGKLTSDKAGEYSVIFGFKSNCTNGTAYYVYSEVMTVNVTDPNATEDVTTKPEEETSKTICPLPDEPTDDDNGKKGCGGMNVGVALTVIVSVLGTAVTVVTTKKHR